MSPIATRVCFMLCAALAIFQGNVQTVFAENSTDSDSDGKPILTVGQPAPKLEVEAWLGEAAKEEITDFQSGQIYVVEFWAMWCVPCIKNIPHLAELQQEYRNQGVTIIGITEDDADKVKAFLKRSLPAAKKAAAKEEFSVDSGGSKAGVKSKLKTYADCAAVYRFASDPDGSSFEDYVHAAGESGIPVAFVVGKTGLIEWVGLPGKSIRQVLDQVVEGTWDREAFAVAYTEKQEIGRIKNRLSDAFHKQDYDQVAAGIKILRGFEGKEAATAASYYLSKLKFVEVLEAIEEDPTVAEQRLSDHFDSLNPHVRRMFFTAGELIDLVDEQKLELDESTLRMLAEKCETASKSENVGVDEGILLYMSGRLYERASDKRMALSMYRRAVAYAKENSKGQLKWFEKELAKAEENATGKQSPEVEPAVANARSE